MHQVTGQPQKNTHNQLEVHKSSSEQPKQAPKNPPQIEVQKESDRSEKEDLRTIKSKLVSEDQSYILLKKKVVYMFHGEIHIYGKRSLFLIPGDNLVRRWCAWIIDWKPWEYFILAVIAVNTLTLALYNYGDRNSLTTHNQVLDMMGKVFTFIFTLECVLEIIARGLIWDENAYLRSGWGWLDFVVVLSGLIEIFSSSVKLKSLRVLRALRPLRSITVIPSMKKLVSALIQTLPEFVNVGIFLGYIFVLFAILGVHLYNGIFYNACRFNPEPESEDSWEIDTSITQICSKQAGAFKCPADRYCGNPADFNLPVTPSTVNLQPFNYYGIHNFNDLANSLQVVFQIVTAESWSTYMYNLMDADQPVLGAIFTISIVALGSLYLMNLILTVIIQTFVSITEKEMAEEAAKLNERAQEGEAQFIAEEVMELIKEEGESIVSDSSLVESEEHGDQGEQATDQKRLSVMKVGDVSSREHDRSVDVLLPSDRGENLDQPVFLKDRSKKKQVINVFKANNKEGIANRLSVQVQQNPTFGAPPPSPRSVRSARHAKLNSSMLGKIDESAMGIDLNKKVEEIANEARKSHAPADAVASDIEALAADQKEAMTNYLSKKLTKEKQRTAQFNKLVERQKTMKVELVNPEGQAAKLITLRDLTQQRLGMNIKRMQLNLNRHDIKLKIIYRSQLSRVYYIAYQITKNKYFQFSVSIIIVLNTLILALDKYPEGEIQKNKTLDELNIGFSLFFMLEAIIKLCGLGFKGYLSDKYNVFDAFIVIGSIIDIVLSLILNYSSRGVMTVLRSFRLMRIFKLAKQWKRLDHLLQTIGRTLNDIGTFSILMLLFMLSFALLGMELFANRVRFDPSNNLDLENGSPPNSNYDSLLNAFTTVFIVLTADGWSGIYFAHKRAIPTVVPTIYFNLLIVIGQKVLLNLFLAILLQNFDENNMLEQIDKELKQQAFEIEESEKPSSNIGSQIKRALCCITSVFQEEVDEEDQPHYKAQASLHNNGPTSLNNPDPESRLAQQKTPHFLSEGQLARSKHTTENNLTHSSIDSYIEVQGRSLFLFSEESVFRNKVMELVRFRYFEYFIIVTIFISSVQLAMDSPLLDPNGQKSLNLYIIDTLTTTVFAVEALLKIVSLGFIFNGKYSYIRNPWNLADFAILVLSIIALTPLSSSLQIFKMFRILRVLRLISRNERLKVAAKALLYALPNIINVTIIIVFFFLIFGIVCVSYFKGKFFLCDQSFLPYPVYLDGEPFSVATKWDCLAAGGEWVNSPASFDNLYFAMNTLFIMATASGWSDLMYFCASTTDIDMVQVSRNNDFWIFFYIIYMIISCFFLLNLFVGVVISTFNSESDKLGGNNLLTSKQREWIEAKVMILQAKPMLKVRPPANRFRGVMFRVHQHPWFENGILVCIILNTVVLALKWYNQPEMVYTVTENLNYLFTAIFISEAVVKISAYGFRIYFEDGWNIFDFIIVISSVVSIFLQFTSTVSIKGAVTIVRAFRIMRVVRLIKRARSLKVIFNTFIVSLPALANIGGMLMLILYLYSILAMELFGSVKRNGIFSQNLNFETFSASFCALCAVATADSWSNIMQAALQQYSPQFQCTHQPTYSDYVAADYTTVGCGKSYSGVLFFYSFYLFVNLIFLNLFIAIILQGFLETQLKDQRLFNSDMLTRFKQVWAEFDEDASSFIKIADLRRFLLLIGPPFGFDKETLESKGLQDKFIAALNLPTYNSMSEYQFMDVLEAISMRLMVINMTNNKEQENRLDSMAESVEDDNRNTEQRQKENRDQLEKDINKLILNDTYSEITAFKEIRRIENRMHHDGRLLAQKDAHFTSAHVATAEWAFARMKRFLRLKQRQREDQLRQKPVVIDISNQDLVIEDEEECKVDPNRLEDEDIGYARDPNDDMKESAASGIQFYQPYEDLIIEGSQVERSGEGESDAQPGFESDKTLKEQEQHDYYEAELYPQSLMIQRGALNSASEFEPDLESPPVFGGVTGYRPKGQRLQISTSPKRGNDFPVISVGMFGQTHLLEEEPFEQEQPMVLEHQFYPAGSDFGSRSVTPASVFGATATQSRPWRHEQESTAHPQMYENHTNLLQNRRPDYNLNSQEEINQEEGRGLIVQDFSTSQLIQLEESLQGGSSGEEEAFSRTQGALSKEAPGARSMAALGRGTASYQKVIGDNKEERSRSNPRGGTRWSALWRKKQVIRIQASNQESEEEEDPFEGTLVQPQPHGKGTVFNLQKPQLAHRQAEGFSSVHRRDLIHQVRTDSLKNLQEEIISGPAEDKSKKIDI